MLIPASLIAVEIDDNARAVITGESQAHFVGIGRNDGFLDLLSSHVQTLVTQNQEVGEQFVDPVFADLHHHDASKRSSDLCQLAALPVALVKANHVGE